MREITQSPLQETALEVKTEGDEQRRDGLPQPVENRQGDGELQSTENGQKDGEQQPVRREQEAGLPDGQSEQQQPEQGAGLPQPVVDGQIDGQEQPQRDEQEAGLPRLWQSDGEFQGDEQAPQPQAGGQRPQPQASGQPPQPQASGQPPQPRGNGRAGRQNSLPEDTQRLKDAQVCLHAEYYDFELSVNVTSPQADTAPHDTRPPMPPLHDQSYPASRHDDGYGGNNGPLPY